LRLRYRLTEHYPRQLPRWDLKFPFHGSLSPECEPFRQLNSSNRLRTCGLWHLYFRFCAVEYVKGTGYSLLTRTLRTRAKLDRRSNITM
jgi:hypothetical protein